MKMTPDERPAPWPTRDDWWMDLLLILAIAFNGLAALVYLFGRDTQFFPHLSIAAMGVVALLRSPRIR